MKNENNIRYDYYKSFILDTLKELREEGNSRVFNEKQLEEIKKRMNIKEVGRDGFAIYIVREKDEKKIK